MSGVTDNGMRESQANAEQVRPTPRPGDLVFVWRPKTMLTSVGVVQHVFLDFAFVTYLHYDEFGERRNAPEFVAVDARGILWLGRDNYVVIPRPNAPYSGSRSRRPSSRKKEEPL